MLQTRFIVIEAIGSCSAPKQLTEVMSNKLANIVEHLAATADIFLRESYKSEYWTYILQLARNQLPNCFMFSNCSETSLPNCFFQNGQEDAQQKE